MKKLIVLAMSCVMLFTAVPMRAAAACDHCDHPVVNCSGIKERIIGGYTHSYTTKHGGSAGCDVDTWQRYCIDTCANCGFARTISYKIWDEHRTKHDQ